MKEKRSKITTYDMVAIAIMAAFVFVATYFFKIDLPALGGKVSIKLGNGICILAAILLGGWRGALAAAIGCTMFDLLDPVFAPEAWITFIRYFIMAGLCGMIAHGNGAQGKRFGRNVTAAIVGAYSYSLMYISSKVIGQMVLGAPSLQNAVIACTTNITASLINATAGVIVALVMAPVLRRALEQTTFGQHVYRHS
ncbi:MAG: ECF transporter S component [Butyricicoccus pullicaecorum]|nr:ECF transporter S component [Butyricicoccus pullicaecorum]